MPVAVIWIKCAFRAEKKEYCTLTEKLCKYALKINLKEEICPLDELILIK